MAVWGYAAIDGSGKEVKGSLEADSREQAVRELKGQGLIVLKIMEQNILTRDINFDFGGKPTPRDLAVFCRQFASITRAGITIVETLNMLAEQTENARMQKALWAVRADVEKGESFSDSLGRHPHVFPGLLIQMARVGEASGSLETAMERMAVQFERSAKTHALIRKAMIYPLAVALVAVAVIVVMLVIVIPQYMDMFEELGTELPGITLIVVNVSGFVRNNWYMIVPAAIAVVFAIKVWSKTDMGRHMIGKFALRIPIVRKVVVKSASALMARTLCTLLAAGVPLIEAVDIVADTMANIWFKEALRDVAEQIMVGVPMSRRLRECGLFPPMVCHMVRIGEESGDMQEMLGKLADYYEEEVEIAVQSLMVAVEPMIIIVLAGIVGVLIGAVMAPMVNMYGALENL